MKPTDNKKKETPYTEGVGLIGEMTQESEDVSGKYLDNLDSQIISTKDYSVIKTAFSKIRYV